MHLSFAFPAAHRSQGNIDTDHLHFTAAIGALPIQRGVGHGEFVQGRERISQSKRKRPAA